MLNKMWTPQDQKQKNFNLRKMYNNVLGQTISDCGRFLFVGNRFGDIFVQDIKELEKTEEPRSKLKLFSQPETTEINCLCFHRNFLIVGAVGVIYGLKWQESKQRLSSKRQWEILIPLHVDATEIPDVNCMWLRPNEDMLYAGCGDNLIYQISLEEGRIVREYQGHTDYIHCLTGNVLDGRIYSASEDGTVRFWTTTDKQSVEMLQPSANEQLERSEFGKWIGAVAADDNWLLCGGGPKPAIFHLNSLQCTRPLPFPGKLHACDFVDDSVVLAGEHNQFQFYALNGDERSSIPIENTATYSIAWQLEPIKFMSLAGFSNELNILTDFRFLDSKVELYGNTQDVQEQEETESESQTTI